jgi:beta-phosphoglucomutase family hydrolase
MSDAAFILDMDGTMVDNARFHARAWRQCLNELEMGLGDAELQELIAGRTNEQVLCHVFGDRLRPEQIASHAERKEEIYRSLVAAHLKPLPGLHTFLERSATLGVGLAVATSAGPANIAFTLDGLGVKDFFEVVVGERDVENGKPHPDAFLTAANRLWVAPEKCLVFEDSKAGVEAAGRAGMAVVVVSTNKAAGHPWTQPWVLHVVEDFAGLEPQALLAALARPPCQR